MSAANASFVLGDRHPDALRQRASTAPLDDLWQRLAARTRAVARWQREDAFRASHGNLGWHSHTPMLPAAALLHLVEDDAGAMAYFREALAFTDTQSRERQRADQKRAIHSHAQLAIAADILRGHLAEDDRRRLLALMHDIAIDDNSGDTYLMYGGGGNIVWSHNVQAAVCALLWGEACGHARWRQVVRQAIDHTRCYLKYGCDEAGFSYEGTGYGHGVFAVMFTFVELLALTGFADLYATEPRLRRILTASLANLFPDRSFLINDNDVGLQGAESMPYLLLLARRFDDPLARGLWTAYQGPCHPIRPYGDFRPWHHHLTGDPSCPIDPLDSLFFAFLYWDAEAPATPLDSCAQPLATYSPGTETVNLRTSWGTDAIYVNLQGAGRSRMSQTHRHADAGHLSIFAHGDYLAIDTGRYNSDEDQHSTMIVDGRCYAPVAPGWGMDWLSGRVTTFAATDRLAHSRIDAAHLKGCHWAERDLIWVPLGDDDAYLILIDNINKDNAAHAFWWQLQLHPEATIAIDTDWQARVIGPRARLDLSFAWPGSQDFPDHPHTFQLRHDIKEWHWPYGRDRDIEAAHEREGLLITSYRRPRLIGELTGLNGHLLSVIAPRRHDAPPLTVRRVGCKRLLAVSIDTPLGTDTIIAALDHGFIRTPQLTALTELLWFRRDPDGRLLATWTIDGAPIQFHD